MAKKETILTVQERRAMAQGLRGERIQDRLGRRRDNSNSADYLLRLGGLSNFFGYLRVLDEHGLVLDIGAGTTRGISQLEKGSLGSGLSFEAVTLSYNSSIKENLGLEKTHITSAENLKGVKDKSVAGVISLFGISYCTRPDLAIYSIDRVLLPGGVIKAGFITSEKTAYSQSGTKKEEFAELFSGYGYDVAVDERFCGLLVAIKPGKQRHVSAEELLNSDSGVRDYLIAVEELFPSVGDSGK